MSPLTRIYSLAFVALTVAVLFFSCRGKDAAKSPGTSVQDEPETEDLLP